MQYDIQIEIAYLDTAKTEEIFTIRGVDKRDINKIQTSCTRALGKFLDVERMVGLNEIVLMELEKCKSTTFTQITYQSGSTFECRYAFSIKIRKRSKRLKV